MNKLYVLISLSLLILGGWYLYKNSEKVYAPTQTEEPAIENIVSTPSNATYIVDGESFTLVNGSAKKEIVPGSATVNQLSVFGEPTFGDIDGDGDDDAVLILVNDPGGSGSFYYAALAINVDGEYKGTDAILLGDRIAPQTYRIDGGRGEINYVVRMPEEDFSVPPSIGKTLYIKYDPETFQLIQIASDFEGEANPEMMKLDMQPWTWIKAAFSDKSELTPIKTDAFTLTFKSDGTVSATTDCNSMSGNYTVDGNKITFGSMMTTLMFCDGSQEQDFAKLLNDTESYSFTSKGELILDLKLGKGMVTFR